MTRQEATKVHTGAQLTRNGCPVTVTSVRGGGVAAPLFRFNWDCEHDHHERGTLTSYSLFSKPAA